MRQNADFSRSSIFLSQKIVIGTTRQAACMDYGLTLERLINSSAERAQHADISSSLSTAVSKSAQRAAIIIIVIICDSKYLLQQAI